MTLEKGAEIGPYRIIERAGSGGMASVYKGYQASLSRYVAIKILPEYLADDGDFRERFQAEATAVASLRHPNIPAIFDYGVASGSTYLATDYIDGGTLSEQMGRPLPLDYTLRILRPVASALDYAHSRGVLHRDIKPSNILLTREGQPMLNDFGLARMMESEIRVTQAPTVMGTPQYMAPEQCAGEEVGPPADIYSFGVMAYQMLTGRVPFSAPTPAAVMIAQMTEALPPPRSVNPELSEGIERALLKALAKEPKDRYLSASGFLEALASAPQGESAGGAGNVAAAGAAGAARGRRGTAPPAPAASAETTLRPVAKPPPSSRRPLVLGAAGLLVLLVAGGAVAFLLTRPGGIAGAGSSGAGAGSSGGEASPAPPNVQFGSPWTVGAKVPQGNQAPRGPLVWQSKLSGDTSDFVLPAPIGDPTAVLIRGDKGALDVAVVKPDGHLRVEPKSTPANRYIAEIEMAIRPGSHFTVRWIFRRGNGKDIGDLAVSIDTGRAIAEVQYLPPNNAAPVGIDEHDMSQLLNGQVFVFTAATSSDSGSRLFLNQEQVADFSPDQSAPTATTAIEAYGQGGEAQVLGLRGYNAP